MEQFVIQAHFMGSHGYPENQFFGGISDQSGAPLWVLTLKNATRYESAEQAEQVLGLRIHSRRSGHTYSVVAVSAADETATKSRPPLPRNR